MSAHISSASDQSQQKRHKDSRQAARVTFFVARAIFIEQKSTKMAYQPIGNSYQQTETVYTTQVHPHQQPYQQQPTYQEQVVHTTHVIPNTVFWNKKVGQQAQCQYCHASNISFITYDLRSHNL